MADAIMIAGKKRAKKSAETAKKQQSLATRAKKAVDKTSKLPTASTKFSKAGIAGIAGIASKAQKKKSGSRKKDRIKTIIITFEYPPLNGGIAVGCHRLARLISKEMDVHVLTVGAEKDLFYANRARKFTTTDEEGITVHRMSPFSGSLSHVLPQDIQNICHYLEELDSEHNFDIIHGFNLTGAGYAAVFMARKLGKKSIVSIRGNDIGRDAYDGSRLFQLRWVLENADIISSNSAELLKLAKVLADTRQKPCFIPNSLDPFEFFYSEVKLKLDGFVVGFVGLVRQKKGFAYLLEAFRRFRNEHEATLLIVGELMPDEKRAYLQMIEELGLEADIMITGRVEHKLVLNYINLIDVYVLPALSEGFPNALLEAMYCKKPCIVTACGGHDEMITDGKDSIIIRQHSSDDIYNALQKMYKNPALRKRIGEKARQTVLSKASPDAEKAAWLGLYNRLK